MPSGLLTHFSPAHCSAAQSPPSLADCFGASSRRSHHSYPPLICAALDGGSTTTVTVRFQSSRGNAINAGSNHSRWKCNADRRGLDGPAGGAAKTKVQRVSPLPWSSNATSREGSCFVLVIAIAFSDGSFAAACRHYSIWNFFRGLSLARLNRSDNSLRNLVHPIQSLRHLLATQDQEPQRQQAVEKLKKQLNSTKSNSER